MRLRNVKGSRETIAANEWVVKDLPACKGHWAERIFNNTNPIHIEIGMGKGQFIMELARLNPDINYIGIEKYSSVLVRALEKMEESTLTNIRFIRMEAENIQEVFAPGEIDQIYLNFSDPWPKDRHAKRRLTSKEFLSRYANIIKKESRIIFKTDNRPLFDFSLEQVEESGWNLINHTFDLHNSKYVEGNIMTEYETRFVKEGKPICRMVITQP
ncbi:MAG: tRNA (guanosine(46)-N7)-methyltransferase TrmB [Lachnospiraceae bacterium]|nr:tRNA (guanosine(46)-N7)-methyltransferase TrmB [Lachnospiraceae bacterium]